jgi:hypothetical protein
MTPARRCAVGPYGLITRLISVPALLQNGLGKRNEATEAEADGVSKLKKTRLRAQGGSDVGHGISMSPCFQGPWTRNRHNHVVQRGVTHWLRKARAKCSTHSTRDIGMLRLEVPA